jgi:uncharacterized protein
MLGESHRMQLAFESQLILAVCLGLGAALYSSVGHAGASAYLAVMALFSVPAAVMRPTALMQDNSGGALFGRF